MVLFKGTDYVMYKNPLDLGAVNTAGPAGSGGLLLEERQDDVGDVFYRVLSFGGVLGWIESWTVKETVDV